MGYPDDDSCPACGYENGSGLTCTECPTPCDEHGEALYLPSEGCKYCLVDEFFDDLDDDQKAYLLEKQKLE